MPKFNITVQVFIKDAILNPAEGPTKESLHKLGFASISSIKMGKCFIISLEGKNAETAKSVVGATCKKLLVNDVVERFEIVSNVEVKEDSPVPATATA